MTNINRNNFQHHPYHLVSPSPWPILTSISLGSLAIITGISMHYFENSYILLYIAVITVVLSMIFWFRDIITEGTAPICIYANTFIRFCVSAIGKIKPLISYFDKYSLLGEKLNNYMNWRIVYYMIIAKEHLTEEGRLKIKSLKA